MDLENERRCDHSLVHMSLRWFARGRQTGVRQREIRRGIQLVGETGTAGSAANWSVSQLPFFGKGDSSILRVFTLSYVLFFVCPRNKPHKQGELVPCMDAINDHSMTQVWDLIVNKRGRCCGA